VIIPATAPFMRIRPMIWSRSGCNKGSPPLIVMTEVPNSPSLSTRLNMTSVGTGFEKSSNSLQYLQARLQRRMGMIWASSGCSGERNPQAILLHPWTPRERSAHRWRSLEGRDDMADCVI